MFKFSLGSLCASDFNDLVSRKRLFSVYRVLLTLTVKCSILVWGHSVHFRFSPTLYMLYLGNEFSQSEKDQNLGLRGTSIVLATVKCSGSI